MAGNIQNLNLNQLQAKLQEYQAAVKGLFANANEARNGLISMKDFWTGQRMNAVLEKYNSINKTLYNNLAFFQIKVGDTLQELFEQYKSMENTGVVADISFVSGIDPVLLEPIPLTGVSSVKFEQEKVINLVNVVEDHLMSLETDLTKMINILDDIALYSDSLNKLVTNYKVAADEIKTKTLDMKASLKTEIDNAVKVVQTTEQYNDSDASRVQSGGTAE